MMLIPNTSTDGYEATRRIREREKAEQRGRTPIVALTASCVKSDRQVCLDSGMDDWMAKPFDQGALCSALLKWAALRAPHDQAER
jgi:CheY-like chemotaxis protein